MFKQRKFRTVDFRPLFFAVDAVEDRFPAFAPVRRGGPDLPHFAGLGAIAVLHQELYALAFLLALPAHFHRIPRAAAGEVVGVATLVHPRLMPAGIGRLIGVEAFALPAVGAGPVFLNHAAVEDGFDLVVADYGVRLSVIDGPVADPKVETAVLRGLAGGGLGTYRAICPQK